MKRLPERTEYLEKLGQLNAIGPVPSDYAAIVRYNMRHSRPGITKRYIVCVRNGLRADLVVLAEIRRVLLEFKEAGFVPSKLIVV